MQESLFDPEPPREAKRSCTGVAAAPPDPAQIALATTLPATLRLGTSSWNYPGWNGLVWDGDYEAMKLSREGLRAYAQHPLLRSVSLDRAFYRPLRTVQYAEYAAQVPEHFRFVVKAPSLVADAQIREEGRRLADNDAFLDAGFAVSEFVQPASEGLGRKLGALVFQLSPLTPAWLRRPDLLLQKLDAMLAALPDVRAQSPDAVVAVELRDPLLIMEAHAAALVELLRRRGATYCLSLHAKMPPIEQQLPLLRALWPGPLVCRWNLHRKHGAYGYETAKQLYGDFDQLVDPDLETRQTLARVAAATASAGHAAYITIGNKAEGCAPRSVAALAEAVAARLASVGPPTS